MVTVGLSVTAAIVEPQHVKSTFTLEIKVKTRERTQQQSLSCSVEARLPAVLLCCVELCLTFQMCLPSASLYSTSPHVRMSISISVYVQ